MYLSLYRKWRPRIFDEICGQEHITSILKKQCAANRVSHAYLFCGTRGTGKTSSAKILAKAVNCENPKDGNPCNECSACKAIDSGSATDVLEIDAASNNRVDNVRDLRDEVVYPPSVLKKRVYIIDEVHMLTDSAFNALLKTLEEPPEYVVFILATTEINELPPTIISRCIRFDFSRIDAESVKNRIEFVANQEDIKLDDGSAELLARLADGSMRDALSLLEACSNGNNGVLTKESIRGVLGLASNETLYDLLFAVSNKDIPKAIDIIEQIHRSSKDVSVFIDDLSVLVRDIMIEKQLNRSRNVTSASSLPADLVEALTMEQLFYIISVLEETQSRISKYSMNKRTILEMAVIRMCDRTISDSPKALAARISELEKKIALLTATGFSVAAPVIKPETPKTEDTQHITENVITTDRTPFSDMSEIYEYLSKEPQVIAFLKQSKVFTENDNIIIVAEDFAKKMLDNPISKKMITEAFTSVIGKIVTVSFETQENISINENQTTLIDEL